MQEDLHRQNEAPQTNLKLKHMKPLLRVTLTTLLACFAYLCTTAQCSADFSYTVGYNKSVTFVAADSLGVTQRWTFGDGSAAVITHGGVIVHIYAQPGIYEVKHFMEKPNSNCKDSVVKKVTVESLELCSAQFIAKKQPATMTFEFINQSTAPSGIKSALWNFGDGSNATTTGNVVHTYTASGNYNVCLTIETNSGCKSTYCQQLLVIDSSNLCNTTAKFGYQRDSLDCKKIKFINLSTPVSANVHFAWKFGDGTTSNDVNPSHVYAQPGKYYVCLVSESGTNCRKEYCDSVIVKCDTIVPNPCNITAKFEYKRDSFDCKKIKFINLSATASNIIHFVWKFGDGTTSNDVSPTHVYAQAGKYYVCLVSEAGPNCRKEYCDSVIVKCDTIVPNPCNITAKFEYRRDSMDCRKIRFINLSTTVSNDIHFVWKFGDGTTSNDISPTHIYAQAGKYYVCLVSEAGPNCRKEYCDSVIVKCENIPPTPCNVNAKFESRHDAAQWNTVWFSNLSQPIANIRQTYWTYGDGTVSQDFNTFHTYANAGTYQVCLKVISLNGCISSYCDTVRVVNNCDGKAKFTYGAMPQEPLTLRFTASYISTTAKYYWSFGDGTSGEGPKLAHHYAHSGKYKACLTVVEGQCKTMSCQDVQLGPNCDSLVVKYVYTRKSTRPNEISFTAVSNMPLAAQTWRIYKDGNSSPVAILTQVNPTYVFTDTGHYRVCLTGMTSTLCVREYCENISIAVVTGRLAQVAMSPNPAISTIALNVPLDRPEQVLIRFMDGNGAVNRVFSKNGATGNNRFVLPVDGLAQGIYLVEIRTNSQRWFSRFQKG